MKIVYERNKDITETFINYKCKLNKGLCINRIIVNDSIIYKA